MIVSALFSAAHLLALVLGVSSIFVRWRALRAGDLQRALTADIGWGVAAAAWIATGVVRLAGTEKHLDFYLANPWFHVKMGLFIVVLLLELWPMIALIVLRVRLRSQANAQLKHAAWLARLSAIELALVLAMPVVAALMVRGVGMPV